MRTLERNKRYLYICKQYEDGDLLKYRQPVKVFDNYTPTNTDSDLVGIGLMYPMYLRIKTDIINKGRYSAGDRLYVYKEPPATHDEYAKDCDYIVDTEPLETINNIEIILKRLSSD